MILRYQTYFSRWTTRKTLRCTVIGVLFFLVLSLGGSEPSVNVMALALLTAGGLAWGCRSLSGHDFKSILSPPLLLVALVLCTTLGQLLPLPPSLASMLSPEAVRLYQSATESSPRWIPLSVDAPATAHEAVKLAIVFLGAFWSGELFNRRFAELTGAIVVAASTVFGVGVCHLLLGAKTVYGFDLIPTAFPTSFINPNHAAAFLAMGALLGVGQSVANRGRLRYAWGSAAVLCAVGVALTLSRGGILAFVLAATATLGLMRKRARLDRQTLLGVQIGALFSVAIAALLTYGAVLEEFSFERSLDSKSKLWKAVPSLLGDYPLTGIGRGALGRVYSGHQNFVMTKTATHLENEWLQIFVDWGVPIGLAVVLLVCLTARRVALQLGNDPLRIASAGCLFYLALHNTVDFNLEMSPVALAAAMLATALVASKSTKRRRADRNAICASHSRGATLLVFSPAVVGIVCLIVLGPPAVAYAIERDTERLKTIVTSGGSTQERDNVLMRHPADFILPLIVAESHLKPGGDAIEALRWINRSMLRAPSAPAPHLLAARTLWGVDVRQQAMLEYRLAQEKSGSTGTWIREVANLSGTLDEFEVFVADDSGRRMHLARELIRIKKPEVAEGLIQDSPVADEPDGLELRADAAYRMGDYFHARTLARSLRQVNPARLEAYRLEASALIQLGRTAAAERLLRQGLEKIGPSKSLMGLLVNCLIRRGEMGEARRTALQLLRRGQTTGAQLEARRLLAALFEAEGRLSRALEEYRRVAELRPQDPDVFVKIARLRKHLGDLHGAREDVQRALELRKDYPPAVALRERLLDLPEPHSPSKAGGLAIPK